VAPSGAVVTVAVTVLPATGVPAICTLAMAPTTVPVLSISTS
jgi:hypothetical protein